MDRTRRGPGADVSSIPAPIGLAMDPRSRRLVDFSEPQNPYFATPRLFAAIAHGVRDYLIEAPQDSGVVATVMSDLSGFDASRLTVSSGRSSLIAWIGQLLCGKGLAMASPSCCSWMEIACSCRRPLHTLQLAEEENYHRDPERFIRLVRDSGADLAVLVNPDTPTGVFSQQDDICQVVERLRGIATVVVDESFIDFAMRDGVPSVADKAATYDNLLVLRSIDHALGLPGLQLAYAVAGAPLTARLREALPRASIGPIARAVIQDLRWRREEQEAARVRCIADRVALQDGLARIPLLKVYPSHGNYLLVRLLGKSSASEIKHRLRIRHGMLIRDGTQLGLGDAFVYIACRSPSDNRSLVGALESVLREIEGPGDTSSRGSDHLRFEVGPEWANVEQVRSVVDDWVMATYEDEDLRDALAMVSTELLENAARYLTRASDETIVLTLDTTASTVTIAVENSVDPSGEHRSRLKRRVAWINGFRSPDLAYLAAMEQVSSDPRARGGLGLVRVAYHGACRLDVLDLPDSRVRLVASHTVDPTLANEGSEGLVRELRARVRASVETQTVMIPPLPVVLVRICQLAGEGAEPAEMQRVLDQEPLLAGRVAMLRTAARAECGLGQRGVGHQLVGGCGSVAFRDLCFVAAMPALFSCEGSALPKKRALMHAYVTACAAGYVKRFMGLPTYNAFLAGLLHDVGRLAVLQMLCWQGEAAPPAGCLDGPQLAPLYPEFGALVVSEWGLETEIKDVVRQHVIPEEAGPSRDLVWAVAVASAAARLGVDSPQERVRELGRLSVVHQVGLPTEALGELSMVVEGARILMPYVAAEGDEASAGEQLL